MGRLALAGIDPQSTPLSRLWRALWALYLDYTATFGGDADAGVRKLWATLAGHDALSTPDAMASTSPTAPTAARPAPRAVSIPDVPIDPETGQPRRPTKAEREAWALQTAAQNDLAGLMGVGGQGGQGGQSGSAEKVGG